MNNSKNLNHLNGPRYRLPASVNFGAFVAVSAMLVLAFQWACSSRRSNPNVSSSSPVRLAILPFNVPAASKDLRWTALAAPILMAKTGEQAQNLEIVPLWETMPVARDNAGPAREFTEQSAANAAGWLSARWSVLGEVSPVKNGVRMIVDFIPSRSNLIPFRYLKTGKIDSIGAGFYDAYNQFLRYLVAKPLPQARDSELTLTSMKDLAEALDREYGWFVEAEPGRSQEAVGDLLETDEKLARFLFNPAVYSSLARKK